MTPQLSFVARLSDEELIAEVKRLAGCEREATARLVAHLAELDVRRLYLAAGFSSLFTYCTAVLCLSEHEAYNRIEAARAARKFPLVLELFSRGALHLTAVRLLAPHLTPENHKGLLADASGKTVFQVEELLAQRFPRPTVPPSVRKLPARSTIAAPSPMQSGAAADVEIPRPLATVAAAPGSRDAAAFPVDSVALPAPVPPTSAVALPPSRRPVVDPLAPDQYRITFTASADTLRKLRQAQEQLRHQLPDGNLAEIFDRALSALLAGLAKKKAAATDRPVAVRRLRERGPATPVSAGRHISAAVRRAVWQRDEGRCAFVASDGRRCGERSFVEFHHLRPFAVDGEPTVWNIALRCRSHNGYEAKLYFGPTRRMAEQAQPP